MDQARALNQEEPDLGELLSDIICQLMMQRDGVTPEAMADLLSQARGRLNAGCSW